MSSDKSIFDSDPDIEELFTKSSPTPSKEKTGGFKPERSIKKRISSFNVPPVSVFKKDKVDIKGNVADFIKVTAMDGIDTKIYTGTEAYIDPTPVKSPYIYRTFEVNHLRGTKSAMDYPPQPVGYAGINPNSYNPPYPNEETLAQKISNEAHALQEIHKIHTKNAVKNIEKYPLKTFIKKGGSLLGSQEWSSDTIEKALIVEGWNVREYGEIMQLSDIIAFPSALGGRRFENVMGWAGFTHSKERNAVIYTMLKGSVAKITRLTTEFKNMFEVPKGVHLNLPTSETEGKRFFECDVVSASISQNGTTRIKCWYPIPTKMIDRKFRAIFSRIFTEFARQHYRENLKGLIYGRGEGIHLDRGISSKKILKAYQAGLKAEEVARKFRIDLHTVHSLLKKSDYDRTERHMPLDSFLSRMNARSLTPQDYCYDKALGVEIEAVCPINHHEAQPLIPHFMRADKDYSIKNKDGSDCVGKKPDGTDGGLWGVEFRILIKRSEMETRVMRAVEAINKLGCTVNKTCGLHIHFDMRDRKEREVGMLAEKLVAWLVILRELVPVSRRENKYCRLMDYEKPHWAGVSMDAYRKHQTLEVRVHSSTINHIKIIQWVRLLEILMESKFIPMSGTSTIDGLKMLNLTEADRAYWMRRHQQLNPALYKGQNKLDLSFLGDKAIEDE